MGFERYRPFLRALGPVLFLLDLPSRLLRIFHLADEDRKLCIAAPKLFRRRAHHWVGATPAPAQTHQILPVLAQGLVMDLALG